MSRTRRCVCLIGISLVLASVTAFAQYGSSLQGSVTDQSGAAVANAKVTATNQATGVIRETSTNNAGFYRVAGLPPGIYTVEAEAATFKKQTTPGVAIAAESVQGVNISLQPGGAQESVTVVAGTEELQTENAASRTPLLHNRWLISRNLAAIHITSYVLRRESLGTHHARRTATRRRFRSRSGLEDQTARFFRLKIRCRL